MANQNVKEEWRLCAEWLVRCKILASDHKVTWPESEVFDLAQTLRDGVLICYLLNNLSPGAIDLKDFSQRPQMSQFLCFKNIRVFLQTCENKFGMREVDLFKPDDLFEMKDFGKVISTLSKLSKIAESFSKIHGFPPSHVQLRRNTDYYNTLEEMLTGFIDRPYQQEKDEDDIYQGLANRAEEQDIDETEDLYDQVYIEDHDEIYDDLCSVRKRKSYTGPFEPKSQRDYCIKELVETERNYVDALQMLIKHFIRPLKMVLTSQDYMDIFKHIEELHRVHTGFQSDLQQACSNKNGSIREVFMKWKPEFLVYGDFCSNLPHAQDRVDEVCRKNPNTLLSMEKCQKEANDGKFKLRDLLSVPMQRVLKYPLLLKELIKTTEDSHPDRCGLEQALEAMQDLALYVNEVKRDHESIQLIQEIENSIIDLEMRDNTSLKDYGKLLKDGELKVKSHDENKIKTRYIFLFDKVMLMCKSRMMDKFLSVGATFSFKNALIVAQHRVDESSNPQRSRSDRGCNFVLVEKRDLHAFTLQAKTEELKRKWIDAIMMALDNTNPPGAKMGNHDFIMHSFDKPTTCDVCGKLLRGVFFQGYKCQVNNLKVHKECIMKAPPVYEGPTLPPRPTADLGRPAKGKCKAVYSFHGNVPSDGRPVIHFNVDDTIELISDSDQFWWEGRIGGREGFFPAKYVKLSRLERKVSYETAPGSMKGQNGPQSPLSGPPHSLPPTPTSPRAQPIFEPGLPGGAAGGTVSNLDLRAFPWYVGEMGRDVAVQRLERHTSGTYLIRSRINERGEYALSIKFGSSVKHIKVNRTGDGMFYLADCKLFRSMPDLVEYYQRNTLKYSFPELQTELVTAYRDATRQVAAMGPRGANAPHNILGYCRANFDYAANQPNQLSLRRHDRVAIISKAGEDRGWWKGLLNGRIGYFPMAYVVEEDENLLCL